MAKVTLGLKVDPDMADQLKMRAKMQGKTVTDLLQEGFFTTKKVHELEIKMDSIIRENRELKAKLTRNGRKPKLTKRVSIPLTLQEYDRLNKAAFEAHVPKSALLRGVLSGQAKPMLTA